MCSWGTRIWLLAMQLKGRLLKLSYDTEVAVVKLNCCLQVIMRGEKNAASQTKVSRL